MSNPKNIAMPDIKFVTLIEGKSTLTDAYVVAVQADSVEKKVKGAFTGVYDVLRHHTVSIYREALAAVNDDPSKIDTKAMIHKFVADMKRAEDEYPASKMPDNWRNSKSKLKGALERGFNFQDNPTIALNKLGTWNKEYDEAKDKQEEADSLANNQENGNVAKTTIGGGNDGDNGSEAQGSQTTPAANDSDVLAGLSDETRSELMKLIEVAQDVEKSGDAELSQKLHNILNMTANQLSGSHVKALKALAA